MPSILLFLVLLLLGLVLSYLGIKINGKGRLPLLGIGIILVLIGGYGVFTALI